MHERPLDADVDLFVRGKCQIESCGCFPVLLNILWIFLVVHCGIKFQMFELFHNVLHSIDMFVVDRQVLENLYIA